MREIGRRFRLAGLVLAALLVSTPVAAQERAMIIQDRVNIRLEPSIDAPIVGSLPKGTVIDVLERSTVWARISNGKVTGWVRGSILQSASGTPAPSDQPAPAPVPASPASAPAPVAAPPASAPAPAPAPSAPPQVPSMVPPSTVPPRSTDDPRLRLGLLGSYTPADGGSVEATHVSVTALVLYGGRLGAYLAPEFGQGAGYDSQMLGAGAYLRLIARGGITLRVAGGGTTYSSKDEAADDADTFQAMSFGGIAELRLAGALRLTARAQQVIGVGDADGVRFKRYAFGVTF
jgi:hypothetical protein